MKAAEQYKKKLDYNNTYNKNTYRSFSVRFNKKSEAYIIEWLESKEGVKNYILSLIEADIKKEKKKAERKAKKK